MLRVALGFLATSLLLQAATAATPLPCDPNGGRFKDKPFCNENLAMDDRVKNYLTFISQADKLGQFKNGAGAMPSVDMPGYQWWSEALHGVAHSPGVHFGGNIPAATSFPQVCLTGASFNRTLYHEVGRIISTEARAMNNEGKAGLTFWTPNINIYRDPRWGRGQETPGEDPYLTSEYVANYLPGLQMDSSKPDRLKFSACCKHYAAYDLENWHGVDRHHFNAVVTKQDLTDTYFPAFESCVTRGQGSGIMCSYNEVNGIPSCADHSILNGRARADWGFNGYITSDCGAVSNVQNTHHYTNNSDDTCKDTLRAGMDIDCGGFLDKNLPKALKDGAITETDIDTALFDLFKVQFRLGMFDNPANIPWKKLGPHDVNTPANQAAALRAAEEGMVLLKNDNNNLPWDASKLKNIAVVGPNANATNTMQGNYYGTAPFLITIADGIQKHAPVTYAEGCSVGKNSKSGFQQAVDAVDKADAVVMVMGLDQGQEREGHDRDIVAFPGVQSDFITTITTAAKGKPTLLIMMNGGPVDLTDQKSNSGINSIMWVGYPGQAGGQAAANIIFGLTAPSGRLPHTVYPANFVNAVSMFDMNMRPSKTNPGRSYRFYTGKPSYEFGSGLHYTTFSYESLTSSTTSLSATTINNDLSKYANAPQNAPTLATVTAHIKNTGKVSTQYVALVYAMAPGAGSNGLPIKQLVQFDKIGISPGQESTIAFKLDAFSFATANTAGNFTAVKGTWTLSWESQDAKIAIQ